MSKKSRQMDPNRKQRGMLNVSRFDVRINFVGVLTSYSSLHCTTAYKIVARHLAPW